MTRQSFSSICNMVMTVTLSVLFSVGLGSGLSSCTSSSEDEPFTESVMNCQEATILKNLQNYNDSISNYSTPSTRGIGWMGCLTIAMKDASGAYTGAKLGAKVGVIFGPKGAVVGGTLGGIIIGGASSWDQYVRVKNISNFSPYSTQATPTVSQQTVSTCYVLTKNAIKPSDFLLGQSLGLDTCAVKIGIQHNNVIKKIETYDSNTDQGQILLGLDYTEKEILNSNEFKVGFNKIVGTSDHNLNPNETSDQVMQLLVNVIRTRQTCDEVNQTVTYYTSVVKASPDLTEEEKEWLYAGFAVMGYSCRYWNLKLSFI